MTLIIYRLGFTSFIDIAQRKLTKWGTWGRLQAFLNLQNEENIWHNICVFSCTVGAADNYQTRGSVETLNTKLENGYTHAVYADPKMHSQHETSRKVVSDKLWATNQPRKATRNLGLYVLRLLFFSSSKTMSSVVFTSWHNWQESRRLRKD